MIDWRRSHVILFGRLVRAPLRQLGRCLGQPRSGRVLVVRLLDAVVVVLIVVVMIIVVVVCIGVWRSRQAVGVAVRACQFELVDICDLKHLILISKHWQ